MVRNGAGKINEYFCAEYVMQHSDENSMMIDLPMTITQSTKNAPMKVIATEENAILSTTINNDF